MSFTRIVGTGSALPRRCVTNEQLAAELATRGIETSDAWIGERTGIRQRYLAEPDESSSTLAIAAARKALEAAGREPGDIDLIVLATSTPDMIFPSTACIVQAALGIKGGPAFDVQAVCSGFVYGLATADALIRTGTYKRALVIGAEVFSRILDWNDRTTCVLFGDGAGAVVLEAAEAPGVRATRLHADGSYAKILCTAGGVSNGAVTGDPFLRMEGQAVFKLAVGVLEQNARELLDMAGLTADQLDWTIPHQANLRILHATAKRLGLPLDKLIVTVDKHGNTSAASVPLALDVAVRDGRIKPGHNVLLQGVGGGFTWGGAIVSF
ncbi:beta-ketoacyl-ACP synthase III [Derxia lacustris]|uniref:beta-ketoacyl-ACP synthase III n=1 Tax=Derxia lacustris TaxID=764842 RepID=UPI000A16F2D7|nr:beta-ketoacyl-ACP synthase III [Derxia lacustris]